MGLDASKFIPGDAKDKLPEFDDRCIDLVVTASPGYREKGDDTSGDDSYSWNTFNDYINYMQDVFTEVYRMLKNMHYCIVVVGDENVVCGGEHNTSKRYPLPAYYTLLLESIGFTYAGECIWDKGCSKKSYRKNETPVYPFSVMPKQCCDHILIFQKRELSNEPVPCPCCGGTDVKP